MATAGLSGTAIAAMALGGVVVYAGFRGVSPLQALKDIGGGDPPGVTSSPVKLTGGVASATGGGLGQGVAGGGKASGSILAAAQAYIGDKYSQVKREQVGWSDCSSFVDKVLTDIGIPPPVKWAASANYRMSAEWKTIPEYQTNPGDVAVSSHHIVLVTAAGGTAAIGQQNSRVNVRTGSVANLMTNQSYVCKTYVGKR